MEFRFSENNGKMICICIWDELNADYVSDEFEIRHDLPSLTGTGVIFP